MTKGEITYEKKERRWAITCEPHIAIKLRRWFGKLGNKCRKSYYLSDTVETARDLKMFAERFNLHLNGHAEYLEKRSNAHKEIEQEIFSVLNGTVQIEDFDLA